MNKRVKLALQQQASLNKQEQQQQQFSLKHDTDESIDQYLKTQKQSRETRDTNNKRYTHAYDLMRSYSDIMPIAVFSYDHLTTTRNGIKTATVIGTIKHVQDSVYLVTATDDYSSYCYCIRLNNRNRNNAINHNLGVNSFITSDHNKCYKIQVSNNKRQLQATNKSLNSVFHC